MEYKKKIQTSQEVWHDCIFSGMKSTFLAADAGFDKSVRMMFHHLADFIKIFHIINLCYSRKFPDTFVKEFHASAAETCLVTDPPLMAVDSRDRLEIPEFIIDGTLAVIVISAYSESSVSFDKIPRQSQSVFCPCKFHNCRNPQSEKLMVISVSLQIYMSFQCLKSRNIVFRDLLGEISLCCSEFFAFSSASGRLSMAMISPYPIALSS